MPSFWSTDVKTARITLKNPTPLDIPCIPYLRIGIPPPNMWRVNGTQVKQTTTIPANGQVTVDITLGMSLVGVGTFSVAVEVYAPDDLTVFLAAQGENLNIYALSVELVGITWV